LGIRICLAFGICGLEFNPLVMLLKIETGENNPVLRKKSEPLKAINKKILRLINDMGKIIKKESGAGLAAPQVGKNIRLILVLLNNKNIIPMINPEIITHSEETEYAEEGCLSLPGKWGNVQRCKEITVRYSDEKNGERTLKLSKFNARVVQHEIDHLNGILFTDYLEEAHFLNVMDKKEIEML